MTHILKLQFSPSLDYQSHCKLSHKVLHRSNSPPFLYCAFSIRPEQLPEQKDMKNKGKWDGLRTKPDEWNQQPLDQHKVNFGLEHGDMQTVKARDVATQAAGAAAAVAEAIWVLVFTH